MVKVKTPRGYSLSRRDYIAYGWLGGIALVFGQIVCGLGCVGALVVAVFGVFLGLKSQNSFNTFIPVVIAPFHVVVRSLCLVLARPKFK